MSFKHGIMALMLAAGLSASASAVTIGFEGTSGNNLTSYAEDGFSIIATSGNFQLANFGGGTGNVLYMNVTGESIRLTESMGRLFNFLSVQYPASNSNAIGTITSSKGGLFNLPGGIPGVLNFSGAEWEGVGWIDITRTGGNFHDIDNIIVVPVPEPATAALALFGLAGLAMRRRRAA